MKQSPILHYDLYVKVKPELRYLRVTGAVKIDNSNNSDHITFILHKNLNLKYIKDCNQKPLFYSEEKTAVTSMGDVTLVTVNIPEELKCLKKYTLNMEYEGCINACHDHSLRLYSDDFILVKSDALMFPIIAEAETSSIQEALKNVFTYSLQAELPKNFSAASAGKLMRITTTTHHKRFLFEYNGQTSSINIAVSHYSTVKDKIHHINVYAFNEHKDFVNFVLMEKLNECAENSEAFRQTDLPYISIIEVKGGTGIVVDDTCIFVDERSFNGEEENITKICEAVQKAATMSADK